MKNLHQIREISTLSFNERVLQEAEDTRNPVLERLKFLGIFSSNMDEFFKVRVASIHRRIELGNKPMEEVLETVSRQAQRLDDRFRTAYASIIRELAGEGVNVLTERDVDPESELAHWLSTTFSNHILPRLVPLIVQEGRTFPTLVDGALYLGVAMWGQQKRYAILELPRDLPRFVELPTRDIMYIDDVIRFSLNDLFYLFEYERIGAFEFKLSRDAELDIDNDFSEDYVRMMERELAKRDGGRPTRFVYDPEMPPGLLRVLLKELRISDYDTLIGAGRYHNMKDLMKFPVRRADLKFDKREPLPHPVLDQSTGAMLDTVCQRDVVVHYPYQSFSQVLRLLREAAIHPEVRGIKMTLYRAAENSQVVNALINAARNGKSIFVSIELQARFDEENNIAISERLTEAGATVVFGLPPMKVHSKLILVDYGGRLVAGLSTGNFNEKTGDLYIDSTMFTTNKRMTRDVDDVFQFLERASRMRMLKPPRFRELMVSPFNTRKTFMRLLRRERDKGAEGYVFIKANHLTDERIIDCIVEAADAGVQMDLVIRTTYAMLPHPNIRAISILDRYLEHQRVYIFGRDESRVVYLSSADLMERNLDWRVEAGFPVRDPQLAEEVYDMMQLQVRDNVKARVLDQTQSNKYVPHEGEPTRAQDAIYAYLRDVGYRARQAHGNAELQQVNGR